MSEIHRSDRSSPLVVSSKQPNRPTWSGDTYPFATSRDAAFGSRASNLGFDEVEESGDVNVLSWERGGARRLGRSTTSSYPDPSRIMRFRPDVNARRAYATLLSVAFCGHRRPLLALSHEACPLRAARHRPLSSDR